MNLIASNMNTKFMRNRRADNCGIAKLMFASWRKMIQMSMWGMTRKFLKQQMAFHLILLAWHPCDPNKQLNAIGHRLPIHGDTSCACATRKSECQSFRNAWHEFRFCSTSQSHSIIILRTSSMLNTIRLLHSKKLCLHRPHGLWISTIIISWIHNFN